jgi:RNA-directed DNA polymerase
LETALKAVVANGGAAGLDGITTEQVKAGAEEFLNALQAQLKDRSYQPGPVKRVWIPKADGKQRPLGIPNVVDRIVQMGLLILLQPIFEATSLKAASGIGRAARPIRRWMPSGNNSGREERRSWTPI